MDDCGRELAFSDNTSNQDWLKIQVIWCIGENSRIRHGDEFIIACPANTSEGEVLKRVRDLVVPLKGDIGDFLFELIDFDGTNCHISAVFRPNQDLSVLMNRKMENVESFNIIKGIGFFAKHLENLGSIVGKYLPDYGAHYHAALTMIQGEISDIFLLYTNNELELDEVSQLLSVDNIFGEAAALFAEVVVEMMEEISYITLLKFYHVHDILYGEEDDD